MRRFFYQGLLILLMVVTSNAYSFSEQGGEYVIILPKQGISEFKFNIPDIYLRDKENLITPFQIEILHGKEVIFKMESQNTLVFLPKLNLKKGMYSICFRLLERAECQEFTL